MLHNLTFTVLPEEPQQSTQATRRVSIAVRRPYAGLRVERQTARHVHSTTKRAMQLPASGAKE